MKKWLLYSCCIAFSFSLYAREDRYLSVKKLLNGESYFRVTIQDSGLLNGTYPGWCADWNTLIEEDKPYKSSYYSSYSPNLPPGIVDHPEHLDEANWLVNQHPVGETSPGGYGVYTSGDMQLAIWTLIDDSFDTSTVGPFSIQRVNELVEMAKSEGSDFYPNCKEVVLILLKPCGVNVQTTVTEVPRGQFDKCVIPEDEVCEERRLK